MDDLEFEMDFNDKNLFLHVDINKTIILSDESSNKPTSILLNQILMQNIYGVPLESSVDLDNIENNLNNFQITYYDESIEIPNENNSLDTEEMKLLEKNTGSHEIIDVDDYVRELYPYLEEGEKVEKNFQENQKIKQKRLEIMNNFLEYEPFMKFEEFHQKLLEKTKEFIILPSFFELIDYLENYNYNYSLIFRTFASINDIKIVIDEINDYYEKRNNISRIFNENEDLSCCGHFIRNIESPTKLLLGNFGENENNTPIQTEFEGYEQIYDFFNSQKNKTMYFKDDYFFWNGNNEYSEFGKLMVVDENDTENFHIFFDDNLYWDEEGKGIVDLRDIYGNFLPIRENDGSYLHYVKPLEAMKNKFYFVEKLKQSLLKLCKRI